MTLRPPAWKKIPVSMLCASLLLLFALPSRAHCKREHLVYFPNTAYELNIYKIYGKKPGKTLLLIGGIQGNEPGGFLSADLYADMRLEKGNLIVVPRANFYSIITNQRGPHGDMNRKFTHEEASSSMEDRIVAILKKLISESDYLLNLHDGAGYYYPKYIDKWRNPSRFGQSIIADTAEYGVPNQKKSIRLQDMARKVIEEVNPQIQYELYRFHFMNTRTADPDSPHKEQRKSATYYALTRHHIPAFGVETSKFLPAMDLKVRFHNLVINAFMKLFDIVPESPGLVLDPPEFKYLVVSINGRTPIVIKNGEALGLRSGDTINVSHIESNYERGLSLDILAIGDLNDYRKDFTIVKDTTMIVRKDNEKFAEIPIRISGIRTGEEEAKKADPLSSVSLTYFLIETGGGRLLLGVGETLTLVRGQKLKIVDILPAPAESAGVKVNFKGFVGDWRNNRGEDRGYEIDTAADLMERYSLDKKGESYEVVASRADEVLGRMIVRLLPPRMDYLVLRVNDQKHLLLRPENKVTLSIKDRICLEEVQTNLGGKTEIHLSINGHKVKQGETRVLQDLCGRGGGASHQVAVEKGPIRLGRVFIAAE
ncbi:MAG: hypothetical protein JXL84_04860 [Deltaproteobacteria bacterium]|nr:hypothetical protein [Deltaproteobacteria bacterium]